MANPDRLLRQVRQLAAADAGDAALLARYVAGRDEQAFATLVGRHAGLVVGVCRRILHDAAAADDVAQATFLLLARRAGRIRRPEAVAAWLHETARNLALSHRRDEARRRRREATAARPVATGDPLDEVSVREYLRIFDEEVGRLPEAYRLPVLLCAVEGCTVAEAARLLGWTAAAVKGRLARGRAALQAQLERRGLGLVPLAAVGVPAGFVARATGPATPAVLAIAEEGLRGMTMVKAKLGLAAAMVAIVTAGVLAALGGGQPPKDAPPAARLDRHGDPLPAGAVTRLGTIRWRGVSGVGSVAFASDGKSIYALGGPGVYVFDTAGNRPGSLAMPEVAYMSLQLLADGKRGLCRGYLPEKENREVVHLVDLTSGRLIREYDIPDLRWLGQTPEGEPLALYTVKEALWLRELASGKERRLPLEDLPNRVWPSYAPASRLVAAAVGKGVVQVWDATTGKKQFTLLAKDSLLHELVFSPDGKALAAMAHASVKDRTLRVWELTTGKLRYAVPVDKDSTTITFAPDGGTLAVVSEAIHLLDAATGREHRRLASDSYYFAREVAFSRDGATLATVGRRGGPIQLWDVATGTPRPAPLGHSAAPYKVVFTPGGSRVVSDDNFGKAIFVWNPATAERVAVLPGPPNRVRDFVYTADGKLLINTLYEDDLEFRDAASGRVLHTAKMADPGLPDTTEYGTSVSLSDDEKAVVAMSYARPNKPGVTIGRDAQITVWDVRTRALQFRRRRASERYALTVAPDLRTLAVSPQDAEDPTDYLPGGRTIRLEDLRTGEHLFDLTGLEPQTVPLAFTADSRLLATNNVVGITGSGIRTKKGHKYPFRLWEWRSGGVVLTLPATLMTRFAFSPDGRLLALTPTHQEILLWDLRRGRVVTRWKSFDSDVSTLAFSPDGRQLVSGHADTTLLIWDVPPVPKAPALDAAGLRQAWADLAGDAATAFRARGALADSPAAVAWLKERLRPAAVVPAEDARRLLADLDSDTAAVRQAAKATLEGLGDRAGDHLREALQAKPSAEVRRQVEALLARLRGLIKNADVMRSLRAVAVLEDIGTPESRNLLEALAAGAPSARLTAEAKGALTRLRLRGPPAP